MKETVQPEKPLDFSKISIPEHRPEAEVWNDLEKLCVSPGYAHALSFLCWRDNFIGYAPDELTPSDFDKMKSGSRLLRSELSLLTGLMVKAPIDVTWPTSGVIQRYIEETEKLMGELHEAMKAAYWTVVKETGFGPQKNNPLVRGMAMREPFFYASEAAYMFQYRDFSLVRYDRDEAWLLEKKGFAPKDIKEIIDAINKIQLEKLEYLREHAIFEMRENFTYLPAFVHSEDEIAEASGCALDIVKNVLSAFSPSSLPCNRSFKTVGSFNIVNAYPLIPIGDGQHMLLQGYSLAESAYETPAFWMGEDSAYTETAKKNRGFFTENFAATRLRHVLGADHVHENVYIMKGKNRVGEIDVLAIYADRAVILQAKSKKLTEAAKKGDDNAIQADFQRAIQDAYDQGFKCAGFLGDNSCRLTDEQGNSINLRRDFREIFIFCVVSEYYPALAHQADNFLKKQDHKIIRQPYVMDIFFLDVLCEMLDKPFQFFNFLHRRLNYDRVKSETELAVLSYHLAYNLWFEEKYDFVDLGDDFTVYVDAAMHTRREGLPGKATPEGVLTRFQGTFFERIIKQIGVLEEDNILELCYFLLEISQKSAEELSQGCEMIMARAQKDHRLHDMTVGFGQAGITVHASFLPKEETYKRLYTHCKVSKYREKVDNWFGIALHPITETIQMVIGLRLPWERSNEMDRVISERFPGRSHKNLKQAFIHYQTNKKRKIGRNDLCLCGSGKKDKKCCKNSEK